MNTMKETVTILKQEYESLVDDSHFLNCLRNAGVDNWEYYDYAIEAYNEENGND